MHAEESSRSRVISTLSDADGIDQKWEALGSIESILEKGSAGEDMPDLIHILGDLSAEGTTRVKLDRGVVLNDFPRVRLEAVRLLGETGRPEALSPLIAVLRNDNNMTVLSEAVLASAGLEQADWKPLAPYFYQILKLKKESYYQDQLIRDVLESIRIIYERDETILQNEMVLEGIVFVAESELGFTRDTRELALKLKNEL